MSAKNTRRQFLKATATASAAIATAHLPTLSAKEAERGIAIILEPNEAAQRSVRWAARQLRDSLKDRGVAAEIFDRLEQAPPMFACVLAVSPVSGIGWRTLNAAAISLPTAPEAVGLAQVRLGDRSALLAYGSDSSGLLYALLELAD